MEQEEPTAWVTPVQLVSNNHAVTTWLVTELPDPDTQQKSVMQRRPYKTKEKTINLCEAQGEKKKSKQVILMMKLIF